MNKLLNTAAGITITALAATALTTPSYAASLHDLKKTQITVHYGDLNTASPEGATVLLNRIKSAARRVCGSSSGVRDLRSVTFYNSCVNQAVDEAVNKSNVPLLTSLHRPTTQMKVADR